MRRVAVAREGREQRVRGEALAAEEHLQGGVRDPEVHRLPDREMAHRVVVAPVRHMAVLLHLAAVHPLADLVGRGGQRSQQRPLLLLEDLPARALAFGERAGVVLLQLGRDRRLQLVEVGEDLVPERRDDLQGGLPDLVLRARLVARGRDARGHHRRAVVRGHLAVRAVELDLALLRVPGHARLQVVRDDAGRRAADVGEGVHVAAQPCILPHVQRRLDVGQPAEGQAGHEQVDLRHLARGRVDERHRRPGPVDLEDPPRLVADAAHHLPSHRELPVALAEPVVGHEGLALRPRPVAVLRVQALQRDADPGELAVDAVPVGIRVDRPVVHPLREQQRVRLRVRHPLDVLPGDAPLVGGVERVDHAGLGDRLRPRYRCRRQPRGPQPQHLPHGYPSRHARYLLVSRGHMAPRA